MSISRRLERLEGGLAGPCPECGGPWKRGDPVEYVVDWGDRSAAAAAPEPPEPLPPCPGCGRERGLVINVVWEEERSTRNEQEMREGLESGKLHPFPLLQHLAREEDQEGARFVAEIGPE